MKRKNILISIKPEYADKILSGEKQYEYRTKRPRLDVDYLIIYWTFPRMKILAKVKVKSILKLSPDKMWKKTKNFSGITKEKFFQYFKNRNYAYAFELGEVIPFKNSKKLSDFKLNFAPQSFVYINK